LLIRRFAARRSIEAILLILLDQLLDDLNRCWDGGSVLIVSASVGRPSSGGHSSGCQRRERIMHFAQ